MEVFAWVAWVGDDGDLLRGSKYIYEQNVGDSCINIATDTIFNVYAPMDVLCVLLSSLCVEMFVSFDFAEWANDF